MMHPLVKWAGGKTQFIQRIVSKVDARGRFVEPFVGGGSVFLNVAPPRLWINDVNPYLINMYRVVKDDPDALIGALEQFSEEYKSLDTLAAKKQYFTEIRKIRFANCDPIRQAAHFIFLNKTCFRGLYRENSRGEFNAPFGNYEKPAICERRNLVAISEYLNRVDAKITNWDYKNVLEQLEPDDFVYLDPPYFPKNPTSFTRYNKDDFTIEQHRTLVGILIQLPNKFLLSNYPHPDFIELFKTDDGGSIFGYETFCARRAINVRQGKDRVAESEDNEILVYN